MVSTSTKKDDVMVNYCVAYIQVITDIRSRDTIYRTVQYCKVILNCCRKLGDRAVIVLGNMQQAVLQCQIVCHGRVGGVRREEVVDVRSIGMNISSGPSARCSTPIYYTVYEYGRRIPMIEHRDRTTYSCPQPLV